MKAADDRHDLDRRDFLKTATAGAVGLGLTASGLFADLKTGQVKRRPLGKTGLEVSVIAFGCGGIVPQHLPLLQKAHEAGINLFDTAWGYGGGQSEMAIGAFVEAVKDRESFHIVTKASGFRPPSGSSRKVYEAMKQGVTASLKRMKTDYVDVFYWPHGAASPGQTENKACRDALAKLKDEKIIRHIGTSSHSNYREVGEAVVDSRFYEVYMPVVNICTQNSDDAGDVAPGRRRRRGRGIEDTTDLLAKAHKKKVGIVAMKVANPGFLGANTDQLLAKRFPDEAGLSRHQKLYAAMCDQQGISSVVVGIRSAKHLMEAIAVGRA